MNKLDKELYTKQAKRLASIINASSPFAKYLTRADFINILKLQLNVLYALEKKFSDVKLGNEFKASKLAADFANLSKTDYKLDEAFKYDDDADYIDAFNYLHTYCQNIYKVDIDELAEGKKVEVATPDINLGADAKADAGGAGSNPYMGAAMGAMAGMEGMEGMMNPFAYAKATTKLNEQVKKGEVYQFKSKPKAIPIIKWVLAILSILVSCALIVTAVFAFMANNYHYGTESKTVNTIVSGIFYLITSAFGFYVGIGGIIQQKKSKSNDNLKYSFTWFVYFGLILLIFIIPSLDLIGLYRVEFTETAASKVMAFKSWKIMCWVCTGLGISFLPPIIVGGVQAPKVDSEKMQGLLQQYMSEFTPTQQPTVKPEGADIQQPVEVKPTEEKKDDKKPDEPLKS